MVKEKIIIISILALSMIEADTLDTLSYYEKFNIALESFQLGRYKLAQNQFKKIVNKSDIFDPTCEIMIANSMYCHKNYLLLKSNLKKYWKLKTYLLITKKKDWH